jgi:micrococcal nuclease
MRHVLLAVVLAVVGFGSAVLVAQDSPAAPEAPSLAAWFRLQANVIAVVDGDTLDARLEDGKRERIRLIGIDAPERGACYSANATAVVRQLAQGKRVELVGDRSQDRRDRYGRLLAYVVLAGGADLGQVLIANGNGRVYVFKKPFAKLGVYRAAEAAAKSSSNGLWSKCTPPPPTPPPPSTARATTTTPTTSQTPTTPGSSCSPSYPDFCIPPPPPDLDCKDIPRKGFRVLAPDPHRFDRDRDGIGCEE